MTLRFSCCLLIAAGCLALPPSIRAQQSPVSASGSSIAVGRDVYNSTFNIQGASAEETAELVAKVMLKRFESLERVLEARERALLERQTNYEINQYQIRTALLIVGENDIPLEGRNASRKHAVIRYERGQYVIYSQNADNPVIVNNTTVAQSHILRQGDEIQLGDTVLKYEQNNI